MSEARTFPMKQGDLDWLCSIYAAVNLRHLRDTSFSVSAADELFKYLVKTQLPRRKWNIGRYVAEGVDPNADIVELFQAAGFSNVEPIDPRAETFAAECNQSSGLLIYVVEITSDRGRFSHYTIANRVTQSGDIALYDSWKFDRLVRVDDELKAGDLDVMIWKAWRIGSPANGR